MVQSVGKHAVLLDCYRKDGGHAISIWSEPRTINQRRDGSFFWTVEGLRQTVTRCDDGSFYLKCVEGDEA